MSEIDVDGPVEFESESPIDRAVQFMIESGIPRDYINRDLVDAYKRSYSETMDGYYWYEPDAKSAEYPDLDETQVIQVSQDYVCLCGSDLTIPRTALQGRLTKVAEPPLPSE